MVIMKNVKKKKNVRTNFYQFLQVFNVVMLKSIATRRLIAPCNTQYNHTR